MYCKNCKKDTPHTPKLDAMKEGKKVCQECYIMNSFCGLIKPNDPNFYKGSRKILWIEFDEHGTFKEKHDSPAVGRSLLMSPFGPHFTWQTTEIHEILKEEKGYVHFKTKNSEYELYYEKEEI